MGFQVDLGIGHAPLERITHAVSCYNYKTNKAYPYYTIRHWIPAIQYACLCYFKIYVFRRVGDTQMTQECPKLGVEGPALGSVAKACCCGAPQPTRRSGYHTGGKVAVWTGIGSIELRRINTAVSTLSCKDKLLVYSWKCW